MFQTAVCFAVMVACASASVLGWGHGIAGHGIAHGNLGLGIAHGNLGHGIGHGLAGHITHSIIPAPAVHVAPVHVAPVVHAAPIAVGHGKLSISK